MSEAKSKQNAPMLKSFSDILKSSDASGVSERVRELPLSELHPFPEHPFKVRDDDEMEKLVESISENGVLEPGIARPSPDGSGYQIVVGHRRKHASELADKPTMPFIVRSLSDDEAKIIMVDSNIQKREKLDFSELAYAYKMKLDAQKSQGKRTDLTSVQVGQKLTSREAIAKDAGESAGQIRRYIRLTELIPDVLDMVDAKRIAFNPAVELSYLNPEEQTLLLDAMESEQSTPSLSQAQRLKKFSQEGNLTPESMRAIMSEEKKPGLDKVTLSSEKLAKYFPKSCTPQKMEETIFKLLEQWHKRQQSQER